VGLRLPALRRWQKITGAFKAPPSSVAQFIVVEAQKNTTFKLNSKHDTQLLNAASDGKINIQEAAQRSAFVGGNLPLQRPVEPGKANSWLVPQLPVSVAAHLEQQCASLTNLFSGRLTAHYSAAAVTQAFHSAACHILQLVAMYDERGSRS
jgi:hypothetical protein